MKITEKLLLDNYIGRSQLGDNLSDIDGERYPWYYSAGDGEDYRIVSSREKAHQITIDRGRYVPKIFIALDGECKNHPAVLRLESEED